MRVELTAIAKGRRMHALPETTTTYESGRVRLICAETEQRPTVLGLIASGRMRPDAGAVTIDGTADASALRRSTALVDAPGVSEPEPNVSVVGVVAEELMFAGLASHPIAARRWVDGLGLGAVASTPIGNVEPEQRIRILCELAVLRAGVKGIILTSPDRHGGEPGAWWSIAEDVADRGFAVLVIAGRASQSVLAAAAAAEIRTIAPSSEDSGESLRPSDDAPTLGEVAGDLPAEAEAADELDIDRADAGGSGIPDSRPGPEPDLDPPAEPPTDTPTDRFIATESEGTHP